MTIIYTLFTIANTFSPYFSLSVAAFSSVTPGTAGTPCCHACSYVSPHHQRSTAQSPSPLHRNCLWQILANAGFYRSRSLKPFSQRAGHTPRLTLRLLENAKILYR